MVTRTQSAIGFFIDTSLDAQVTRRGIAACDRALRHFPWLKTKRAKHGDTDLYVWGHRHLDEVVHTDESGNLFILIGSPVPNGTTLKDVADELVDQDDTAFELPWEGRCILLRISVSGRQWTMWNDWTGSIPVFHTQLEKGHVASTLEPAVVDAAGFTPDDFFLPGLVSLLVNGHYLGDWTLFEGMHIIPPDSVTHWDKGKVDSRRLWTVEPTDERWHESWDTLVDEMYYLSHRAIADTLRTQSEWILPLSAGLDSRLIAAVGADTDVALHAYTYGHRDWIETVYAQEVARVLGIPWQRVPIPPDYLKNYTQIWLEWFGSALHCHGMYQMPFLTSLERAPDGQILQGYMGDPLAGGHVGSLTRSWETTQGIMPVGEPFIEPDLLGDLLAFDSWRDAVDAVAQRTRREIGPVQGSHFQQLMFLDFWNRQRLFIYYQPVMYEYFRGVATPFLDRDYARFCLSLPRHALENRRLQKEMLRRHYPDVARIGGTFGQPLVRSRRYIFNRSLATLLPRSLRVGTLRRFATTGNRIQIRALQAFGKQCLWPFDEVRQDLGSLFDLQRLEGIFEQAAAGNETAYNQLRPIQAIAWHYIET